jgi:uncharacterized BrkB/YihY/UPF0761 family membrane protein
VIRLDLRPLGIGEILDRAVTLFLRRFAVLVLILALVAIPVAILQYAAAPSTTGMIADLQRALSLPPGHSAEQAAILRNISQKNNVGAWGAGLILGSAILGLLATTACIIGAAQAYAGKLPSVREVYREALRRWLAQVFAMVIFIGFGLVLTVLFSIVVLVVALAIGALAHVSRIGGTIVGVPIVLLAVLTLVGCVVCLYFSAQMTVVAIALEDPNPIRGIAHGLRRTLSPAIFGRSVLVATIVFAVSLIGSLLLISLAAALTAATHIGALYPIVTVIGGVALNALVTTFIVVYAVDVRVRREGYDLSVAAEAASP